ncbi:MAG: DUF4194 domain-containing protein, partial [Sulfuricellaceae bacterium]|nr:DUF4194 domain-containing protein [Sulfuricellaceae bacterium]
REQTPQLWHDLLALEAATRDYLAVLGLDLDLDDAEGYAFVRQRDGGDEENPPPRLVARRPLSYPVSLLCVLLRKRLLEADASGGETRTMITRADMLDLMRTFLPEASNEARIVDKIDEHIGKVEKMGFLRELAAQRGTYEIRRVLKAFVDGEWLADFDARLEEYRKHAVDRA